MSKKQKEVAAETPAVVTEEPAPEAAPEVVQDVAVEAPVVKPSKGIDLGNGTIRVDH